MHAEHRWPLIIGHRGASGYRPEHSEDAYRLAFALGADAVEPDIVATRDGVLVVRHENEISGTTNIADFPEFASRRTTKMVDGVQLTGWFTEDFTWTELSRLRCTERLRRLRSENTRYDGQQPVLRLRDVLRIVDEAGAAEKRSYSAVVEIKHAAYFAGIGLDLVQLLREELRETGWDARGDQLIIESFELGALEAVRTAGIDATLVMLTEHDGDPADEPVGASPARSFAWYRSDAGLAFLASRVEGISVAKRDLLRVNPLGRATGPTTLIARAHAAGLLIFTWTLRPENRYLNPRFHSSHTGSEWGDWQSEFAMILQAGVDGIFVDHADLGQQARAEYAAQPKG